MLDDFWGVGQVNITGGGQVQLKSTTCSLLVWHVMIALLSKYHSKVGTNTMELLLWA